MVDDRLRALHDNLVATAELPLDRAATRWVAEAQAVADDCLDIDDPSVLKRRVGHVRDLLANVETTGHPEADDHVDAASELAAELASEGPEER